jgi:hypothetical protein
MTRLVCGKAYDFFDKMMDLSLLIFTLENCRVCMKCTEFTTRTSTYNSKNLAVGSLIWSAKTGVNLSYFPQTFSIYVPCSLSHIDALGKTRRLGLGVPVLGITTCPDFYYATTCSERFSNKRMYIIGRMHYGYGIDGKLRISRFQQGVVYLPCSDIS